MRTISRTAAIAALLVAVAADPVIAAGDAARGERLARRWCAGCHLVAADQTRAAVDAPSFAALAGASNRTPEGIADFLALPGTTHSRMPDLALSRVEIDDLVAYLGTLKR